MDQKLIIISPYPPKDTTYENKFSALASFGKNTVWGLQKNFASLKILVLADIIPEGVSWQEKNLEIKRVWKRGSLGAYFSLLKEITKEKKSKKILIELEWNLFGKRPLIICLMPFFILLLGILSKQVFVVTHGIALDFLTLTPQLGLKRESLKADIFNWGMKIFYTTLIRFSFKIIVLEQHFARAINLKFKTGKAVFIPHGVDTLIKPIDKNSARKKLRLLDEEFLLVNFGFLNWYKGSDLLADTFLKYLKKNPDEKIRLVFAGGESQVHKTDPSYLKFVADLKATVAKSEKMKITGFLPEEDIPLYFSGADLLIFPYRVFISSSGPLSFAFSFKRPVLISSQLKDYFESDDMRQSLKSSNLKKSDILFEPNEPDLSQKLSWIKKEENLKKLITFSEMMQQKRSWDKIGQRYLKILKI